MGLFSSRKGNTTTISDVLKKISFWAIFIIIVGMAFFGGVQFNKRYGSSNSEKKVVSIRDGLKGRLINPLLICESSPNQNSEEFERLKKELKGVAEREVALGNAEMVGIYVRDLNSSQWVGVHEDELFNPASLLKVPLMMTYFKHAEKNPHVLEQKVIFKGPLFGEEEQIFKARERLAIGKLYDNEELIERMIRFSDNDATQILSAQLKGNFITEGIFSFLKTAPSAELALSDYVSPKDYSFFFRTLYNSSYLNDELSQKALGVLSHTDFDGGLVAGVPSGVVVAHKFGERGVPDSKGDLQKAELHDCGIVYNGDRPYFICVMTKGKEYTPLATVIQEISKITYTFFTTPSK